MTDWWAAGTGIASAAATISATGVATLRERRERDLAAIAAQGVPYRHVSHQELPPPYQAWLHSALPDAQLTVLPASSSHFPHLSHPKELAALL